jgi:tetratricopeptide (TPR) repeat protein
VKRKVYFLTDAGEAKSRNLKDFATRQGIEIMPLLDLKKCKGEELWNQLTPELRSLLAKAVVFRKPFKRAALPQTNVNLLPEDREGMVELPSSLQNSIPSLMEKSDLREAHSFAADYWLAEGDYVERLHHLLQANRGMEAQMLLANRGWQMARSSGPELLASLKEMTPVMSRHSRQIRGIRGESARRNGDIAYGSKVAEEMLLTGEGEEMLDGLTLKGRLLLAAGKPKESMDHLEQVRKERSSPLLDCDMAMCLGQLGRKEEAVQLLESIGRKGGISDPDLLEEVYARKGEVHSFLGRREEAIANYSKALGLARPGDKREIYRAIAGCYEAMDMKDKAREYSKKALKK